MNTTATDPMPEADAIGVDLGSFQVTMAAQYSGRSEVKLLESKSHQKSTPTCFGFYKGKQRNFGQVVLEQQRYNLTNTITYISRFLGANYDQISQYDLTKDHVSFDFCPDTQLISLQAGQKVRIEQVLAAFLTKMFKTCALSPGQQHLQLAITVPIYFGDTERQALINATKIANIVYPIEIVKESVAISLFYAFQEN